MGNGLFTMRKRVVYEWETDALLVFLHQVGGVAKSYWKHSIIMYDAGNSAQSIRQQFDNHTILPRGIEGKLDTMVDGLPVAEARIVILVSENTIPTLL